MVALSLTVVDVHLKDGDVQSSANISFKTIPEKHDPDATCFEKPTLIVDAHSEEGRLENNCCNGDTKGSIINCNHGSRLITETQSIADECGHHVIRASKEANENDDKVASLENRALLQEPTTRINSRAHIDKCKAQQPTNSTDSTAYATIKENCAPKGKRVRWSDDHGKELVHVFEYGSSDTEESEDDEEDTDTCTCTIQ